MDTALKIWGKLTAFTDIKSLIGEDETLFLEFKCTSSPNGRLTEDDKRNLSKAISGFAHRDGGVIVWGILTEKINSIDKAKELTPISKIETFKTSLESCAITVTDPVLDGIQNTIIFENDNASKGAGFLATYIPPSNLEHQSKRSGARGFYKRFEQGHILLPTADVKLLFFRNLMPALSIVTSMDDQSCGDNTAVLDVLLKNEGRGLAKFITMYLGLLIDPKFKMRGQYWDPYGGDRHPQGTFNILSGHKSFERRFQANSGVVIHPGEDLGITRIHIHKPAQLTVPPPIKLKFLCYAENMVPIEDELKLTWRQRNSST